MPRMDIAVPILPARDLDESIEFYGRLGFQLVYRHPELKDYVIVRRAKLELHLFHWPQLDTQTTFAGAYLRVKDVDELYEAFSTARLPARGTPSMAGIKRRAWGMREFNLVDCSGNLLRVGEPIPKSAKGMAG